MYFSESYECFPNSRIMLSHTLLGFPAITSDASIAQEKHLLPNSVILENVFQIHVQLM